MGADASQRDEASLLAPDLGVKLWQESARVRGAIGYRDNVTLSQTNGQSSPYWDSGADFVIYRLPTGSWLLNFVGSADDIRYFRSISVQNEQTAFAAVQVTGNLANHLTTGGGLSYTFQNQVEDVTALQTNQFGIGRVFGHTIAGRWFVRKDYGANWVEAEMNATREFVRAPLDDFWQFGPRITVGRRFGHGSDVSFNYRWNALWYASRTDVDLNGNVLPGTSLAIYLQTCELTWHQVWDAANHWHMYIPIGVDVDEDNATGYFDFVEYRVGPRLEYRGDRWKFNAWCRFGFYHYPWQTVNPARFDLRYRTDLGAGLHVERRLTKSWKVFGDYNLIRSLSNVDLDNYQANTVSAGLEWQF